MYRLILIFFICFLFIGSIQTGAQEYPVYFKTDVPEFIPVNEEYRVSSVIRVVAEAPEMFYLYILVENNTEVKNVLFRNYQGQRKLKFVETDFDGFSGYAYRVDLDTSFNVSQSFQILTDLVSRGAESAVINFAAKIVTSSGSVVKVTSSDSQYSGYTFAAAEVVFYDPANVSGRALYLEPGAFFTVGRQENLREKTAADFWIRGDLNNSSIFTLKTANGDTLLNLNKSFYGMIYPKYPQKSKMHGDIFMGKNGWYHFLVSLDASNISVFVNGTRLLDKKVTLPVRNAEVQWSFRNNDKKGYITIDRLRFWKLKGTGLEITANKHYQSFDADSSALRYGFEFDEENFSQGRHKITYDKIKYVNSGAPVYSRQPELNVRIHSNYYALEWNDPNPSESSDFIVEKSNDGTNYSGIFTTPSDKDADKVYYFTDAKNPGDGVIYYRVKQFGRDSAVVYSPEVKIGQGRVKEFESVQNYPNPFNPATQITVNVLEAAEITIAVYDIMGNKVKTLYSGNLSEGSHSFKFDGTGLPSGIYIYEVKSPYSSVVRKMILAK